MALKRSRNCCPLRGRCRPLRWLAASWAARTMIGMAALVDVRELQFLDRVGHLVQVMLGQMQIPGRYFQILMAEQKLDGAQVGAGFKQVCSPAVANQVRCHLLTDAGPPGSFGAGTPHNLVCNRLLAVDYRLDCGSGEH